MFHLEVKRKVGDAELPPIHFDVDDNVAWAQLIDALQLECACGEHPVYVAFGEYKGGGVMFWNKCSEKMPPVVFKSEWCDSDKVHYGWYESDVKIAARRGGEIVLAELLIEYDTEFGACWRNVSNDMVLKDVVAWADIPKFPEVKEK